MKKILSMLAAFALILTLSACGEEKEEVKDPVVEPKVEVKSGTYKGHNGDIIVNVTLTDDVITAIEVTSQEETASFYEKAVVVIDEMVETKSTDVDTIAGATVSSQGLINAVKTALGEEVVVDEVETKTITVDGHNDKIEVEVTVINGELSNIVVLNQSETASFYEKAFVVVDQMIESKSTNVDTINGATVSSKALITAVKIALGEEIETETNTITKLNGIYEGIGEGWQGAEIKVNVTVLDGKITKVELVTKDAEDGIGDNALTEIPEAIVNQNTPDVDVVAGGTVTSNGIINAVKDALK